MRYYVIINGINSLTIPGLAIKDLPPISKTLMRNQKETIDGRDGDIITELGYSAYDKALTIGLYGSYDINDIIAFFNQKGTIVFSDEPDKYYNFTILDQIDYDKLVKFRTATIRIHCQPFKYPVTETPVEIEAEYVTAQAEEMTLNDTGVAPLEIGLKGNTYQETTTGKNLIRFPYDATSGTYGNVAVTINNDGSVTFSGTGNDTAYVNIITQGNKIHLGAGTYTLSTKNAGIEFTIRDTAGNLGYIARTQTSATFTLSEAKDVYLYFAVKNGISYNVTAYPMLETGSSATEWEKPTNGAAPNPDFSMPVQVVTGNNTIKVNNKNLFDGFRDLDSQTYVDGVLTITGWKVPKSNYYKAIPNQSYTFSFVSTQNNTRWYLQELDENYTELYSTAKHGSSNQTFTLHNETKYFSILFNLGNPSSINYPVTISNIQLELGTTATEYTPYQSQNYPINLGTLELCKIGTYQDYLYKSGENWYKHTEIKKHTFIGNETENWSKYTNTDSQGNTYGFSISLPNTPLQVTNVSNFALSNYFKQNNRNAVSVIDTKGIYLGNGDTLYLKIDQSLVSGGTTTNLKTWLTTHNTDVYYVLATPTEEQITNAELIEQLEAILNAVSYEDQTNISQENDNLPFILDVSALQKGTNEAIIDNDGNIYSKPIINIVGDGIVGVSLNGSQILSLDMTTYNDITIDTETMEAYDSNGLRNRQVTGNYNNLRLQPGENTISLNGGFTSATISKYKRWL